MGPLKGFQYPDAPPPTKMNGLSVRLVGGLVALIALICGVSFYVIWCQGRPLLANLAQYSQTQLGQNITLALGQELSMIEGITKSMASIAVQLPKGEPVFHNAYPAILNQLGQDSVIAGGGIWPEEYAFNPSEKRHSFFWGRNAEDQLEFYNDYNEPEGDGYHTKEWYVPAHLLPSNSVYWSRSYTDPYSLQPMVTCTAPMLKADRFVGVATVDLMLDGVSSILDSLSDEGSYAFVVDRNNKFISFPQPELVLTYRQEAGKRTPDFMYVSELADKNPVFLRMAEELDGLEYRQFMSVRESHSDYDQYVKTLDASSDQINLDEARRISSHLWLLQYSQSKSPVEMLRFSIDSDLILKEKVSVIVFQMPMTNWKVVTVFKQSHSQAVTNSISYRLILSIMLSVILFGLVAYVALKGGILKRLKIMSYQLQLAFEKGSVEGVELNYGDADELGALVYWFNRRTAQVDSARKQAEKANQDKTDFLAKMSHEFRVPLNAIIGFSHRLRIKLNGKVDDLSMEALNSIYRSAEHQLDLINDILDHGTIESGVVKIRLGHESVNGIIDSVVAKEREVVVGKKLTFTVQHLPVDENIYCDKNKISQVLSNLISNSVKATEQGGITLSVVNSNCNDRASVSFSVVDSGIGIQVKDQSKLFKPFSQLDSCISTSGTGLGLFLSRHFVNLHDGDITLSSNPDVEPGATFTVRLPLDGPVGY